MEGKRRKPLTDCTNTIASLNPSKSSTANSSSIINPTKSRLSATIQKLLKNDIHTRKNITTKAQASSTESTTDTVNNDNNSSNPSVVLMPPASTPPQRTDSSSRTGTAVLEVSEPCLVYSRRQSADKRKSKAKATAMPVNFNHAAKTQVISDKMNESAVNNLSTSCIQPYKKKQRVQPTNPAKHTLPQDYIERQRDYFAEVDAFELPEEVASADELE